MKTIMFIYLFLALSLNVFAQEIVYNPQRALWDANIESDLAGYSLYVSENSEDDDIIYEKLSDIPLSNLGNIDKPEYFFDLTRVNEGSYAMYVTRSEEHTSELQSHSFISYAVFCLKKKNLNLILHK